MESFKILGQAASNGTNEIELYSVPVTSASSAGSSITYTRAYDPPVQTLVTSIIICNTSAASGHEDFSLMLYDSSSGEDRSSTSVKNYLLRNISVNHQETKVLSLGLTLSARTNSSTPSSATKGDVLKFTLGTGSSTNVAVTAMGVEIT